MVLTGTFVLVAGRGIGMKKTEEILLDMLHNDQECAVLGVLLDHIGRFSKEGLKHSLAGRQWYLVQIGNALGLDTSRMPPGVSPMG
jgi:hypothetical protein